MKAVLLLLPVLLFANELSACSVCFGDPNSPMSHGARAGILMMLGVLGVVLGLFLAVAIYWIRRARLLQVQAALQGKTGNPF